MMAHRCPGERKISERRTKPAKRQRSLSVWCPLNAICNDGLSPLEIPGEQWADVLCFFSSFPVSFAFLFRVQESLTKPIVLSFGEPMPSSRGDAF